MKYRLMGLGLFAAAGLSQCQPACTPTPGAAPAPLETTIPATVRPPVPVTTLPVIPLGVSISRECENSTPAFSVTNDSNVPIIFSWMAKERTLVGGDSMMELWPSDINGLIPAFDWTASDESGVVFDRGTLFLEGASGTMDCTSGFNAVIDAASSCPNADTVEATIFASAPVGYDEAAFVFHHVWHAIDQLHDEVVTLPMTSDRTVSWSADVPAPDGFGLPALSATVSFIDNDGVLPTVVYPNGGDSNTTPMPIHPNAC
jgi:hypothetical protein